MLFQSLRTSFTPRFAARNLLGSTRWMVMAALFCVLASGCGGGETPPQAVVPPVVDPPAPVVEETPEDDPMDTETPLEDETDPMPEVAVVTPMVEEKQEPEVPQRPKELEKWSREDYLAAKREGDRRLDEAVELMGTTYAGNPKAAELFKELLVIEHLPAEKKPDGTLGKPKDVEVTRILADSLIHNLAKNETPEAAAILKDILFSKLETPVKGRRGVILILEEMCQHLNMQENEDLVFGLLTDPQGTLDGAVLVPEDPYPHTRLQTDVIGMLSSKTTPQLSLRLAKFLDDPNVPKNLASEIETMLIRERPDTLPAKLILYQNERAEKRTINAMEASIMMHSEEALSILLGLPPKLDEVPAPGTISRPTVPQKPRPEEDVKLELDFATQCWTPELNAYLMLQINKKGDLGNSPGPVQLIGSMPTARSRFSMSELMAYHAYRGPRSWNAASMFGRGLNDPAFVVMAKSIYHNTSRRVVRVDPNDIRPTPDQTARDAWKDAMEPLKDVWVRRFYSAARNSKPEDWADAKATGNFKIVLHKDAKVVTEYHLVWPGTAQAQIPGVELAGLEVHYLRIEEEAVPEKLANHYKRYGATGPNERKLRVGYWFDDLSYGSTPKSKRSTDIMISHKPIPESKTAPGAIAEPLAVPLVIDILTIEVPEIADPGAGK